MNTSSFDVILYTIEAILTNHFDVNHFEVVKVIIDLDDSKIFYLTIFPLDGAELLLSGLRPTRRPSASMSAAAAPCSSLFR